MRALSQEGAVHAQLQAFGVTVLVVGFFRDKQLAAQWADETGCVYPVLLDNSASGDSLKAGSVYADFGFRRSYSGTWSSTSLSYYASALTEGTSTHPSHGHDIYQLGGDVVLYPSEGGHRVYAAHYSTGNTDRVAVGTLLQECRGAAALGKWRGLVERLLLHKKDVSVPGRPATTAARP